MNLSPQAWTAIWAVVAFVVVLAVCCFGPPLMERLRGKQFDRESERCAEDEKQWWLMHAIEQDARRVERKAVHRA